MSRELIALAIALVACDKPAKHEDAPVAVAPPADAAIDATMVAPPIDAAVVPAIAIRKLAGPFASIEKYCATVKAEDLGDEPGRHIACDTEPMFDGKRKLAKTPPFDEARLFVVEALDPHCQLGVRIGKSWYVLHEAVRCLGDRAKSTLSAKVIAFAVENGRLAIRVLYDQSTEEYSPAAFERTHFELLTLCAIGTSGVPSCTRELPLKGTREEHAKGEKTKKTQFKIDVKETPAQLTLAGDTSSIEHYLVEPLAPGTYALAFP